MAKPSVSRPLLVCFSHLRWNFVYQRPQHLLSRAAADWRVVFWEEPEFADETAPRLRVTRTPEGVEVATPVLPRGLSEIEIDRAQRVQLDSFLARRRQVVELAWFYTPMALAFAGHLRPAVTVYDCMDELTAFAGASPRLVLLERMLLRRADLVFTGGRSLQRAKQRLHPSVHCFPSAVDAGHFLIAREPRVCDPADQEALPRPRIGYFGVLDERLDSPLLAEVARLRPEWHFVLLGPTAKIDPASLPGGPNVHWLGPKSYADLPRYLAGWDAGFMPFAANESTRFISPTKTPEYLAAGVPLVSTPVADVVTDWGARGLVEIADDATGAIAALLRVMKRDSNEWRRRVDRALAGISWDRVWDGMQQQIELAKRGARAPAAGGSARETR